MNNNKSQSSCKKLYHSYTNLSPYYKPYHDHSRYPFFSLLFLFMYTYNKCNKLEKEIQELKNKK